MQVNHYDTREQARYAMYYFRDNGASYVSQPRQLKGGLWAVNFEFGYEGDC